jgi:hypothetical protein
MIIPSPWPWHSHTRAVCKLEDGREITCTQAARLELEVDDDVVEVLLIPVKNGRPGAEAVGQPRIWSRSWGTLEVEDYQKKIAIEKEEEALKKRLEEEKERKAKEAKERTKKYTPKAYNDED